MTICSPSPSSPSKPRKSVQAEVIRQLQQQKPTGGGWEGTATMSLFGLGVELDEELDDLEDFGGGVGDFISKEVDDWDTPPWWKTSAPVQMEVELLAHAGSTRYPGSRRGIARSMLRQQRPTLDRKCGSGSNRPDLAGVESRQDRGGPSHRRGGGGRKCDGRSGWTVPTGGQLRLPDPKSDQGGNPGHDGLDFELCRGQPPLPTSEGQ